MNINKLILDTLNPLNVPASFQKYTGVATTYITFFSYLNQSESFANNIETSIGNYVQIDIWSKDDYTDIVTNVKLALAQAGFRKSYETEMFENETLIYHKVLRFFYLENV